MPVPQQIAVNFFPLEVQDFEFTVYRTPYVETSDDPPVGCHRYALPQSTTSANPKYTEWWVSFAPALALTPFVCNSSINRSLTRRLLQDLLVARCHSHLTPQDFSVAPGFHRRVDFVLERFSGVGERCVWLSSFFLKSRGLFGFLADFRFRQAVNAPFNRETQRLSFSLDNQYRENSNFYVDRYGQLQKFTTQVHDKVFPLLLPNASCLGIRRQLIRLPSQLLEKKKYVFANGTTSLSQFMGVRDNGPLTSVSATAHLCFMYRPENKPLSHDLFRALRGDTYATFAGMEKMFRFPLNQSHVTGVPIDGYDHDSLTRAIASVPASRPDNVVVPVLLVPWTRHDETSSDDDYYRAKHCFLSHRLPSQFVGIPTITNKRTFKWTISNIGLALFAKMGGHPWKVQPRNADCLIVGVGQSHKLDANGAIDRYYAYSVLTDSSGLYESLKVLSHESTEQTYLQRLRDNLCAVFRAHSDRFRQFAIHTTFTLRHSEMKAIEEAIATFLQTDTQEHRFVVLKFNDQSQFFGFSETANSMVPYESTYVQISKSEFLVWFEGLQFQKSAVVGRVGRPVHVEFIYPREPGLTTDQQTTYLQDALNLSGANWRGFNAKTLPVSVYYAHLIARYCREFHRLGLAEPDLEALTPWFL